jgi:acetyl esterase/lipase
MTPSLTNFVSLTGVPILSVDYRLSPEHAYPGPLEDCWASLLWVQEHAGELAIDVSRIAVMGESAGGGLAAALALVARDRSFSPPLAKQILMYPMLDDRTEMDLTGGLAVFAVEDVITGWSSYLGELYKTDKVPASAAVGRLDDVHGLPPLFLDCGQLDMFIHEGLTYAHKLVDANIPVDLHVYPGVPHAFQRFAPGSNVAQRALANRVAAMRSF